MGDIINLLKLLVNDQKLAGWVRALVASGLATLIAKYPGLSDILDPVTQATIATLISGLAVGIWSHLAKKLSKDKTQ